jgi:tRNA dimethylallyltransferase
VEHPERLEDAVAEIKLRSRQYAKRQLTWFGRNPEVRWHSWNKNPDFAQARRVSTKYMQEHGLV